MPTKAAWNDIPDPSPADIAAADADLLEYRLAQTFGRRLAIRDDGAQDATWLAPAPNARDGQLDSIAYALLEGIPHLATPLHGTDPHLTTWEDGQHSVQMLGITMFAALAIAVIVGAGALFLPLT